MTIDDRVDILRRSGNVILIIGYLVLVHVDVSVGASMKIIGAFLIVPFCVHHKYWDFLFTLGFFSAIDLSAIITHMLQ